MRASVRQAAMLALGWHSLALSAGNRVDCPVLPLNPADANNYCTQMALEGKLQPGTACLLRPEHIHPTQHAIGKAGMHCHRRQLEKMTAKELHSYKLDNQVPVFVGPPGHTMYISDKHHLSTAMFEAELELPDHMLHRALWACIQDDLSNMELGPFWKVMNDTGNCYPFDHHGRPIEFDEIPTTLKKLRDDPYRTLSRYVRTSRGFVKCGGKKTANLPQYVTYMHNECELVIRNDERGWLKVQRCQEEGSAPFFIEFKWADYLRNKLPVIRDTSKPQIRPHTEDYVYAVNFQSQIDALRAVLSMAVTVALQDTSSEMPGYNRDQEMFKPALAEIDQYGCDNDPSQ